MLTIKILAGGFGLAAIAGAAPAPAQVPVVDRAQLAVNQCTGAVQNRLSLRTAYGDLAGGRVIAVTRVNHRAGGRRIQVRGLASSNAYGPYGVGAYGLLGATQGADLVFRCSVDQYGRVRDIDINRR
jgi:hypothetical protein